MYSVAFTKEALEDLERIDVAVRKRILRKIQWCAENFSDLIPLPLNNKWRGFFKLRTGDWRIIYDVDSEKKMITIHYIGHRSQIYKRKNG